MLIIADENIEHALIEKLKEHFEVISIYQSHRGSTDDEIAIIATQKMLLYLRRIKILETWYSFTIKLIYQLYYSDTLLRKEIKFMKYLLIY